MTLSERLEGNGIDENQLYGKVLVYLSRKIDTKEFQNKFPEFLEQYIEDLRKEIESLQTNLQVSRRKPFISISADPSECPPNERNESGEGKFILNIKLILFREPCSAFKTCCNNPNS